MKLLTLFIHEFKQIAGRAVYFLVSFTFIFIILKLTLHHYYVDLPIFPKIVLGSFITAKATFVVDKTWMGKIKNNDPRYIKILRKTFFYTLMSAFALMSDSLLKSFLNYKSVSTAFLTAIDEILSDTGLAVILFLFAIFLNYNIYSAMILNIEKGKVRKFFFGKNPQL